jgi:hypothetical protein
VRNGCAVQVATPVPGAGGAPFFVVSAERLGAQGPAAWVAGFLLHLLVGVLAGAAFGALAAVVTPHLWLTSTRRAVLLGAVYGFLVWVFFFGSLMSYQVPRWESMYAMDAGALAGHLVFGGVIGWMTYHGAPAVARLRRCERCGEPFESVEGLAEHRLAAHGDPRARSAA